MSNAADMGHDLGAPVEAPATAGTEALSARPTDQGHSYGQPVEAPPGAGTEALELAPAVEAPVVLAPVIELPHSAAIEGVPTVATALPVPSSIEALPFTGGGATTALIGAVLVYAGILARWSSFRLADPKPKGARRLRAKLKG